jgi:hypothetical protein
VVPMRIDDRISVCLIIRSTTPSFKSTTDHDDVVRLLPSTRRFLLSQRTSLKFVRRRRPTTPISSLLAAPRPTSLTACPRRPCAPTVPPRTSPP